jgi:hypothetical protein
VIGVSTVLPVLSTVCRFSISGVVALSVTCPYVCVAIDNPSLLLVDPPTFILTPSLCILKTKFQAVATSPNHLAVTINLLPLPLGVIDMSKSVPVPICVSVVPIVCEP